MSTSILSSILGAVFHSGGEEFETEESLTLDAEECAHLSMKNTNGNITVEGGEETTVTVRAVKKVRARSEEEARERLDAIRIVVSEEKPELSIVTDVSKLEPKRNYSVNYDVRMPRGMSLTAQNANGNVAVSDLGATVEARTQNGNVRASRIQGEVKAKTTNGNVDVVEVEGSADAQTTNGNVSLEGVAGLASGSATNGNIRGNVTKWEPGYAAHLHTTNGNVTLRAPEDVSAAVTASVQNGSVQCDLPVEASVKSRKKLEGTIGTGEGTIELKTTSGNVRIHRAE